MDSLLLRKVQSKLCAQRPFSAEHLWHPPQVFNPALLHRILHEDLAPEME
jgi:hypothetical protein